jgi:hypothetical protein
MGFRRAAGRLTGLLSGASQLKHPFTAPTLKPASDGWMKKKKFALLILNCN